MKDAFLVTGPRGAYALSFLLAVLNSRLLSFWYLSTFTSVDVHLNEVIRLPIRRIDFTTPAVERKRFAEKWRELFETAVGGDQSTELTRSAEEHLAANRTDVIHDMLAFLAERMMAMNKEKQVAARGFLNDLKDFHGVDAHSLKPKTQLDEFWKLAVSDVFTHFKANTKTLAAQGVRLKETDEESVRARFQKAADVLVPLETRIAFADRLIDQIVSKLYGLTTEEIAIVEGAS